MIDVNDPLKCLFVCRGAARQPHFECEAKVSYVYLLNKFKNLFLKKIKNEFKKWCNCLNKARLSFLLIIISSVFPEFTLTDGWKRNEGHSFIHFIPSVIWSLNFQETVIHPGWRLQAVKLS